MYDELIKALRHCTDETVEMCPPCPYFAWDKQKDNEGCMGEMMRDAADAIERLVDERDKLREAYNAVHKEYGEECYAFRFGYLDQTVKLILGITEDNNEQQS